MSLAKSVLDSFEKRKVTPVPELIRYLTACEHLSSGNITDDSFQHEMCIYLDSSASRVRCLSEALSRVKEPSISEIVTECVTMMVHSIFQSDEFAALGLKVTSETNVKFPSGEYRKPDVAVWDSFGKLLLVVECKTSLGRRRKEWLQDYEERVKEFESVGLDQNSVLLFVGTENSWKGFNKDDPRYLSTWFSMCKVGSWYGGGKAGEIPLQEGKIDNMLFNMKERMISIVRKKAFR